MQIFILAVVGLSARYTWLTQKVTKATANAIREYRRELGWIQARLDALEQELRKRKEGQQNGRAETSR
jgi:hypothetical protein